jgi:hypothetical protein
MANIPNGSSLTTPELADRVLNSPRCAKAPPGHLHWSPKLIINHERQSLEPTGRYPRKLDLKRRPIVPPLCVLSVKLTSSLPEEGAPAEDCDAHLLIKSVSKYT